MWRLAAATIGLGCGSAACGEPTLRLIGNPFGEIVQVLHISGDGAVPGGVYADSTGIITAGLWTSREGCVALSGDTFDPSVMSVSVQAMSADGRVAAVMKASSESFDMLTLVWRADGSLVPIHPLGTGKSAWVLPRTVSATGDFVGGTAGSSRGGEAFIWSFETGTVPLGFLGFPHDDFPAAETLWVGDGGERARGISTTSDGSCGVFEWTLDGGMTALSDPVDIVNWLASGSPDGSAITGFAWTAAGRRYPFLWTESAGFEELPPPLGDDPFFPTGVSNGGGMVVGNAVWTRDAGYLSLDEDVVKHFDLSWRFGNGASDVSADGNTIAGIMFIEFPQGWGQLGFIYRFDDPCPADLNRDGSADFFDLVDFVRAFRVGDLFADENLDTRLDFFDVQQYLDVLAGGCP